MIIYNYDLEIEDLEQRLNEKDVVVRLNNPNLENKKRKAKKEYDIKKKIIERARKLGKGMDKVIALYNFDLKEQCFWIDIIDSKDYIDGVSRNKNKNLKRFNEIDQQQLKRSGNMCGIEYIFLAINFSDFEVMFKDKDLGYKLKTLILENKAVEDGVISADELIRIRNQDLDEYYKIFEKLDLADTGTLQIIKDIVKNSIEYVDIDKMLMTCAYRLEEKLEEGKLSNSISNIKTIVETIYTNVKDNHEEYHFDLYFKEDGEWIQKEVTYSAEDIKRFLDKFTKDSYLTESKINETREKIKRGDMNLLDTGRNENDIIFKADQLEGVALLSDENLAYVAFRLGWSREKIIEKIKERKQCSGQLLDAFVKKKKIELKDITNLYLDGFISMEQINEIRSLKQNKEYTHLANPIELVEYYDKANQEGATEEEKQKYEKYVELYKTIKLSNKQELEENESEESETKESETEITETQEAIEELMNELLKYYNEDDIQKYYDIQGELYTRGILSIDDIKEWNNDEGDVFSIISRLYMQNKIDLNQIIVLIKQKKLDYGFGEKLATAEGLEKEKRMEVLSQGVVDEENIFILYLDNYINEDDLLKLADLNIVNKPKVESYIRNKNNPDNKQFEIAISGNLKKINYSSGRNSTNDIDYIYPDEKNKKIIDPNQRLEYFDLFGAKKVENVRIPKESPFYEYEFFALPDENGEFSDDSVVIAERFYEETEEHIKQKIDAEREKQSEGNQASEHKTYYLRYATDNATYFFRARDIIALKEYTSKTETVNDDGIIFKVDHNLADDSKVGSWASGVLWAITKTRLSSDFKGLTKREQRIKIIDTMKKYYEDKNFNAILDKLGEIDRGEHNGDLLDEYEDIEL